MNNLDMVQRELKKCDAIIKRLNMEIAERNKRLANLTEMRKVLLRRERELQEES